MSVTVRGGGPLVFGTTGNPVTGTLDGDWQPQAGDLLVLLHCNDFYTLDDMPNVPTVNGSATGVEAIDGTGVPVDAGASAGHVKPYLYRVTAAGDVALSVTEAGDADEDKAIIAFVLVGADLDNPVDDAVGAFSTASQSDHELPPVSPPNPGGLLISHINSMGGASADHYEPPAGMAEAYDIKPTAGMSLTGATETLSTAGPTGTRTFAAKDSDGNPQAVVWCGLSLVIKAAGTVLTDTVDDSTGLADTAAAAASKPRTVDDTVGLADEDDPLATAVADTSADAVGLSDSIVVDFSGAQALTATVNDTAGIIDSVSVDVAAAPEGTVTDQVGISDNVSVQVTTGPPPQVGDDPQAGTADLGDAVELTFATATGATVWVSWWDPQGTLVVNREPVPESPAGSGQFPYTYLPAVAGMWTAVFYAAGTATAVEAYFIRVQPVPGPAPLATVDEFGKLFRPMTAAEHNLAATLLRYASGLLRGRFPYLDGRIARGELDANTVTLATINMVLRVMRNPAGLPPLASERVGPFSRSYFNDGAAGLLVITPAEEAMVAPAGSLVSPVGTVMARPGLARWPVGIRSRRDLRRWW